MALHADDISLNTIIGIDSSLVGNLRINGLVRIDGDVDGNIETTGKIIIGEKARIRGSVIAKAVVTGGVIQGDIIASDSIHLLSTALVFGDVIARKVQIEQNVILQGYCVSLKNEEEFLAIKKQWNDMKAITSNSMQKS